MHIGRLALGIVIDVGIVKTRNILALDQLRRLPVGITMGHTVAQVVHIIIQIIKIDKQSLVPSHHEDWRDVHVVGKTHLE